MKPKRLIIHLEHCDVSLALARVSHALPLYYETKPQNDRRLTVEFGGQGEMIIYHDRSDIVIFSYTK